MCFATVILTVINLGAVAMHHNKDTQKEIVVIEAAVWALWVFVFFAGFLLAKLTF